MNEPFLYVLISLALATVFIYAAVRQTRDGGKVEDAVGAIRSLDIEAFRNLVDPDEDDYLRSQLPPAQLHEVRRERSRAALMYMKELSSVSLKFARLGDAARRSPDPAIAAWGREVADSAIQLRLRTLETRIQLRLAITFPRLQPNRVRPLLEQVDRANHLAFRRNTFTQVSGRAS